MTSNFFLTKEVLHRLTEILSDAYVFSYLTNPHLWSAGGFRGYPLNKLQFGYPKCYACGNFNL